MLYRLFSSVLDPFRLLTAFSLFCFILTLIVLHIDFPFLPRDKGRGFAVDGEKSKGKLRGVGLLMLACFLLVSFLFLPFTYEFLFYALFLTVEMLSGYLDDASAKSWSEYKKGLIDLFISVCVALTFLLSGNSTDISIGNLTVTLPPVIYGILASVLVWMSINAVNCTDGVDGLSSSVAIVSFLSYLLIFKDEYLFTYQGYILLFVSVLAAYLLYNASPSRMLMGDAGSRPVGVLLAILAMKSHHPFSYLLLCFVFIADGLVGLVKIFLKRFLKISILKNTVTPLHDEMRKNHGWSDTQVVIRFAVIQCVVSLLCYLLLQ